MSQETYGRSASQMKVAINSGGGGMFRPGVIPAPGRFVAPSAGYDTRALSRSFWIWRDLLPNIVRDVLFFSVQLAPMRLFLEGYQVCGAQRLGPNVSECGLSEEGCVG